MKILNWVKNLTLIAIGFQFAFQPLAMANQLKKSNVALVKEFLKTSGLNNKKITVGEFYKNVSSNLTEKQRQAYHSYALILQDETMPSIEPVIFTDNKKVEQVRLIVNWNKKTYSLQTDGFGEDLKVRFNNSELGTAEFGNPMVVFKKIVEEVGPTNFPKKNVESMSLVPSREQWKKMTGLQRLQYLSILRYVVEGVQNVLPPVANTASVDVSNPLEKFALVFELLNPEACASVKGKPCAIAGWASVYGDGARPRCGGKETGFNDLEIQVKKQWEKSSYKTSPPNCVDTGSVPCNPMIYGFDGGSKPHCMTRVEAAKIGHVSRDFCREKSPLKHSKDDKELPREQEIGNIKRIIDSHIKALTGNNSTTKIEQDKILASEADYKLIEKYISDMDNAILEAHNACKSSKLPDQVSACDELTKRKIAMANFKMMAPAPGPLKPPATPGEAAQQVPGLADACKPEAQMCQCELAENGTKKNCKVVDVLKPAPGIDLTKEQKPPTRDIHDETGAPKLADIQKEEPGYCDGEEGRNKCIGIGVFAVSALAMFAIIKNSKDRRPGNSLNPIVPNPSGGSGLPPPGSGSGSNPTPTPPPPPGEGSNKQNSQLPSGGTRKAGQK